MSDDIDIEEHDILENPHIQDILPQIVKVKSEPVDLDDEDFEQYDDSYDYNIGEDDSPPSEDTTEQIYHRSNRIILGSKPAVSKLHSEVRVLLEDWNDRLESSICYCRQCCRLFATRNGIDAHNMTYHSFLVPIDKETNTARKSTTHITIGNVKVNSNTARKSTGFNSVFSMNVARKSTQPIFNAARKTTARKSTVNLKRKANTARKSTGATLATTAQDIVKNINKQNIKNAKYCNHCNKHFSDNTELIKHLYELIISKPNPVDTKNIQKEDQPSSSSETSGTLGHYYRCSICSCYYRSLTTYNSHVRANHNGVSLTNKVSEVPYVPVCWLCNQTFKRFEGYNSHVQHIHPDVYRKYADNVTAKILCSICKGTFENYSEAKRHIADVHPECTSKHIFKMFKVKSNVKTLDDDKEASVSHVSSNGSGKFKFPIPKSVLFKCNKCDTHFLTCASSVGHASWCRLNSTFKVSPVPCDKCKRLFKPIDIDAHYKQHSVNDKFKVYLIHDHMHSRVAYQCLNCSMYFDEKKFICHLQNGCKKSKPVRCTICNINFHSNCIKYHKKIHHIRKFIRDDFILIDFIDDRKILKRKLEWGEENSQKVAKRDTNDPYVLLYCDTCKCYFRISTTHRNRQLHLDGECRTSITHQCTHCALTFRTFTSLKLHTENHKESIGELSNYTFLRLIDEEPIVPPQPEFPYCKTCKVYILKQRDHICRQENVRKCNMCYKRFSETTYNLHLPYHKYKVRVKEEMDEMPKLMEKYESLTTTWNILYTCESCDTTTDSYDKVIEHCQNHFSHLEHYGVTIRNCKVCDFNFDEPCYLKHLELHNAHHTITRDSFRILTFCYYKLFSKDWMELFRSLSTMQIRQIQSKSIHVAIDVKMRLLADGFSELTIYKCKKCNVFVDPDIVSDHVHTKSCGNSNQYECSICYIPFTTFLGQKKHEKLHEIYGEEKSFRVVGFNEIQDEKINETLRMHKNESEGNVKKKPVDYKGKEKVPKVSDDFKTKKKYMVYKCVKCMVALFKKKLTQHVCVENVKKCNKCKQYIPSKRYSKHLRYHELVPKFTNANLVIALFDPDKDYAIVRQPNIKAIAPDREDNAPATNSYKVFEVYQCRCGLHFSSEISLGIHIDVCSTKSVISKENCSKCGLLFPTQSLVSHLCSHHSKGESTIVVKKFLTFYRCGLCKLLFIHMSTLTKHMKTCNSSATPIKCSPCNLNFHSQVITAHRAKHRRVKNLEKRPFEIITIDRSGNVIDRFVNETRKTNADNKNLKTLYRCSRCDVHYLTLKSLRYHMDIKHIMQGISTCGICHLKFSRRSLPNHMRTHHTLLRCRQKDFNIINASSMSDYQSLRKELLENERNDLFQSSDSNAAVEMQQPAPNLNRKYTYVPPSHLDISQYNENLYKCSVCSLCFLIPGSLVKHQYKNAHAESQYQCTICGHYFTAQSLSRHQYIHHTKLKIKEFNVIVDGDGGNAKPKTKPKKLNSETSDTECNDTLESESVETDSSLYVSKTKVNNKDEISIDNSLLELDLSQYSDNLYQCTICSLCFLRPTTLTRHHYTSEHRQTKRRCLQCGYCFTKQSLLRHEYVHHQKMCVKQFNIVTQVEGVKLNMKIAKSKDTSTASDMSIDYKDSVESESNVSILTQNSSDQNVIDNPTKRLRTCFSLSEAVLSKLDVSRYSEKLYKCHLCPLHFLNEKACDSHLRTSDHKQIVINCGTCGLEFTQFSLPRHQYIHHEKLNFKRDDFIIIVTDLNPPTVESETKEVAIAPSDIKQENITDEDDKETVVSQSNTVETVEQDDSVVSNKTAEETPRKYKIELFKCGDCNVFFLTRKYCCQHTYNHKPLLAKDYIECKLCGFQFKTVSLFSHMKKHHNSDFNLEDILIEEYRQDPNLGIPRKETYYADDRDQSRLVSTTADINEVTESKSTDLANTNHNVHTETKSDNSHDDNAVVEEVSNTEFTDVNISTDNTNANTNAVRDENSKTKSIDPNADKTSEHIEDKSNNIEKDKLNNDEEENNVVSEPNLINETEHICVPEPNLVNETEHMCVPEPNLINDTEHMCVPEPNLINETEHICVPEPNLVNETEHICVPKPNFVNETEHMCVPEPNLINDTEHMCVPEPYRINETEEKCVPESNLINETEHICVPKPNFVNETEHMCVPEPNLINETEHMCVPEPTPNETETLSNANEPIDSKEETDDKISDNRTEYATNCENVVIKTEAAIRCNFCTETFKNQRTKEFHESLEHLDEPQNCRICSKSFNISILKELHLSIKDNIFTCCICNKKINVNEINEHSVEHRNFDENT
ncbi:zinc finger protein Xfin-like [Achroia grisella]|uniref:zinc finger protein Xfin-like n=1 Tax=Achroia grisella TaxID=688607 RepID=UPI0027D2F77B|nr:zinc finger protein Xfin-like [Achroia grisella]